MRKINMKNYEVVRMAGIPDKVYPFKVWALRSSAEPKPSVEKFFEPMDLLEDCNIRVRDIRSTSSSLN
jgi:hypothetical protein